MKKINILVLFYLTLVSLGSELSYRETTQSFSRILKLKKENIDGENLVYVFESDTGIQKFVLNRNLETIRWEIINKASLERVVAEREISYVKISFIKDNKIHTAKKVNIDISPWYQLLEVSLSNLKNSKDQKVFWVLRPNDFKPFKLQAKKVSEEIIKLNNKEYETYKIMVTLHNMPMHIWSAHYWFDKKNSTYIKYEGKRGPPNTPKVIVELIE